MEMLFNVVVIVAGFVMLVKGSDAFVNGSVSIAAKLKLSPIIIGLTVVAFGTSAPELAVSSIAAWGGSTDIAIGNVVGSNLFNLIFIMGICSMMFPMNIKISEISRDFWVSVGSTVVLLILVLIFGSSIPRYASLAMLVVFAGYTAYVVSTAVRSKEVTTVRPADEVATIEVMSLGKSILFAVVGLVVLMIGGQLTVNAAVSLAYMLGMSERLVGLTIVAVGTSLPELVTAISAFKKSQGDIALGLIIGSNIFNVMFILGIAGSISPLAVTSGTAFDLAILVLASVVFFIFAKTGGKIVRLEGAVLVIMFATYITFAAIG